MAGQPLMPAGKAAAAGADAAGQNKPKLVQVGLEFASLKDLIRIYTDSGFTANGEEVYSIVFKYFKGYDFEERYTFHGEEGEAHRDQEYGELATRLEMAGYDII
jgi:negative regulator of genetic competence, sporulation and motility